MVLKFILFLNLIFISYVVLADENEKYVSLKDLSIYGHHSTAQSLAKQLEQFVRSNMTELADQTLKSVRPQSSLQSGRRVSFAMLFSKNKKSERPKSSFLMVSADLSAALDTIVNANIDKILTLSQTRFSMEVSLVGLKALVSETVSGAKFVYPVGGAAFDDGVLPRAKGKTIFATPAFTGIMSKNMAIESRTHPTYYGGKPFLRISPAKGSGSLYGFHTTPFDYINKHKPANDLARGYISAGCLRLKDDDLLELYQLVANSQSDIPVLVKTKTEWPENHPYPIISNGYHTVSGFCWKVGEGSSQCLEKFQPGARPVFSTQWKEKDPEIMLQKLHDYNQAKVSPLGFEIP